MTSKTAFADITANKLVNKINDLTIGEDSTDYLTVNSETRFLNDVNIGGSSIKLRSTDDTNDNNFIEIMGERLHSTHVKTIRSINNNKIEGDLTIGEDTTDLLVVNSDTKFTDNIDVDGNLVVSGNIKAPDLNQSVWAQLGADMYGEAVDDGFGYSISLNTDGTIVAIGGYANDGNEGNVSNAGHVRVFEYSGSFWSQLGSDIDGSGTNALSGYSVSLSSDGTILAVGEPYYNSNRGLVKIYEYSGSSWSQKGSTIDGEAASNFFGTSVSLSSNGTILAIGARGNADNGSYSGHVRVYEYSGSSWSQKGGDIDGEAASDQSGFSVSLSSNGAIVAIGAHINDGNGTDSGHVRVYQYSGNSWSKLGNDIDGEAAGDNSGNSVSLSSNGTILAIGAYRNAGNGTDSGHVRVYEYSNGSWSQKGGDIDGEAAGDYSGWSVSLSSDGTIVAIGAFTNDANGANAGHVRVYQYSGTSWSQLGSDIDGEAAGDYSGRSVSLSSDGTIVSIGAMYNDANGNNAGLARVYKITNKNSLNVDGNLEINGNIKAAGSKISGSIVQTQHLNYVAQIDESYTSSTFTDFDNNNFVVSINPTSTKSRLLFNCNIHVGIDRGEDSRWYGIRLYRKIGNGNWTFLQGASGDNGNPGGNLIPVFLSGGGYFNHFYEYDIDNLSGSYLDTPDSSLNTHYYTLYWDGRTGDANLSPRIHLNRPNTDTSAFESRPISTLTIQEIYYP